MDNKDKKMTPKQIIKLTFSIVGIVCILAAVVIACMFNFMPKQLQMLPLPLALVAIAIMLILKTTGKSMDIVPNELKDDNTDSDNTDKNSTDQDMQTNLEQSCDNTENNLPKSDKDDK